MTILKQVEIDIRQVRYKDLTSGGITTCVNYHKKGLYSVLLHRQ